jgi:uncharacterized protein GlcG (DUF336 family)
MDGAVAAGPDVALATAATAARFGVPSDQVREQFGAATGGLAALHPVPFLAAPGGSPLHVDGRVIGGLGVGGAAPDRCAALAKAVA